MFHTKHIALEVRPERSSEITPKDEANSEFQKCFYELTYRITVIRSHGNFGSTFGSGQKSKPSTQSSRTAHQNIDTHQRINPVVVLTVVAIVNG
jgi:hypothetical protein